MRHKHKKHGHRGRRAHGGAKNAVARFVKHVTFDRGCPVEAGAPFNKVWRVRNDSDAPWATDVQLVHVGGDAFGVSDTAFDVRGGVVPGDEVDVSATLIAPNRSGHYHGHWRLVTRDGQRFGPRLGVNVVVPAMSSSDDAGVVAAAGAGGAAGAAGVYDIDGARRAELNAAAVATMVASAPPAHAAVVTALISDNSLVQDPVFVKVVLGSVGKMMKKGARGMEDPAFNERVHKKVSKMWRKYCAKRTKVANRRQRLAKKAAKKQAKKAAKQQAKKAAKQAKKAAKQAKKAADEAATEGKRAYDSDSSTCSSSGSSSGSSSDSSGSSSG